MREISSNLTEELKDFLNNKPVSSGDGYPIATFKQLIEQTAKLSILNKDYLLFYRGQIKDYKNKAENSTLYPSIYRGTLNKEELSNRFDYLKRCGNELVRLFKENNIEEGYKEVKRREYIQWSILQHYEVCNTPLLDLTHSLRVAASFALLENKGNYGYVYVFGMPYITNRISINSEHDIVQLRLLSICPPEALRPYYQEGYLAGTTDITNEYDSKTELDLNNRLIAKFKISAHVNFWGDDFTKLPKNAIYPPNDEVKNICDQVKANIEYEQTPTPFSDYWSSLTSEEQQIITMIKQGLSTDEIIEETRFSAKAIEQIKNGYIRNLGKVSIKAKSS